MTPNVNSNSGIVPRDKDDLVACDCLMAAGDDEVIANIEQLLACLRDLRWSIAGPVSDRLLRLDHRLILPVQKVLLGSDETWKYWIISYLLHHVNPAVLEGLRFILRKIAMSPTPSEIDSKVTNVAHELMQVRPIK